MKETRFFYDPELNGQLPDDEAKHAVRVLRLAEGDVINLMDGRGTFCEAEITTATNHRCLYRITEKLPQQPAWTGHLHLAVAPTKLNDRMEWLAEKATEIGFDELSFLRCRFSERKEVKSERMEKIVVSAMKQSHKAWKPVVNEMVDFKNFVMKERPGQKFICHCYDEGDVWTKDDNVAEKGCLFFSKGDLLSSQNMPPFLLDIINFGEDVTVLIGPEGDFSVEEVKLAKQYGYRSASLGTSRLRTETAALVAVHLMQIKNQKRD